MVAYYQPTTLDEALRLKAEKRLLVLAGGTDIYPAKATRAGWGQTSHPGVLDISRIPNLRGIARDGDIWRIGALTTWTDIARADLPALFRGLQHAAREIGGIQIQNRGTIAGNLCNASPAADGVPCLLSLDASVDISSRGGTRVVPLAQFIDGYRHTTLATDEIVTGVRVPHGNGSGHFVKLGARKYLVISIVMAASVIDVDESGIIRTAKIAVGACSPVAQRLVALEQDLMGTPIHAAASAVATEHLASLSPIDDVRASGEFRAYAALQVVRDLLAADATQSVEAA